MTKRVVIIGGGIAGPVAAIALRRAGFDPVVHEAHAESADGVGAFLTVASNGLAALDVLGLADAVDAAGFRTPAMRIGVGAKQVAALPMTSADPAAPTTVTLTRAALYGVLRGALADAGIPVEYGKRLTGIREVTGGVEAVFADGTTARGDHLVGADGLRSTVRGLIDPHAPAPRYVPLLNTGGYADTTAPGEVGTAYMTFGKRAFFAHLPHPDGSTWWFANVPRPREPSRAELAALADRAAWRGDLLDLYAEDTPAREVIAATADIVALYPTHDFPTVPTWHRGRVVIIGDAAHATSPAAGQGASMAVEDAVVLARCLRERADPFAAFEAIRRPRVEKVVRMGKRNGDQKAPGAFGRLLLPALFRLMPKPDLAWLLDHRVTE